MENASKALIIAGSVLIAIMVISLLVMAYNNLTETMNAKNDEDAVEQVVEFNKQYDVYYRNNLYGSDILSIANKVADYNERQSKEQGYSRLEIEVTFTKSIDIIGGTKIIRTTVPDNPYKSEKLKQVVKELEDQIDRYKKEVVPELKKTIYSLSGLRSKELELLLKDAGISAKENEIKDKISKYRSYSSALTTLKSKTFSATEFIYDNTNKRITIMRFKEN